MEKSKTYPRLKFRLATVKAAFERFADKLGLEGYTANPHGLMITIDGARWSYDNLAEFWADYRRGTSCELDAWSKHDPPIVTVTVSKRLNVNFHSETSRTTIFVEGPDRAWIEDIFGVFEQGIETAEKFEKPPAPPPPPPSVFIGHGRSSQWKELRDHLRDHHGVEVVSFESGARAGHTIRDILEDMTNRSSLAFLVLTAEDEAEDGLRARQNVVHELGLCQGRLGFNRSIAIVEDGVEVFSNLDGIQQIRYPAGRIRETFGDVLATIRREFPPAR